MFPDRVLSGIRPTGRMHIGHYHGALKNWLRLQEEHECLYFAADWHALTTHYETPERIEDSVWEMFIDWLAVGINPARATVFIQSHVPEHAELTLLLGMIAPVGWLERVPTYKDQQEKLADRDLSTYGFLGYPVMQGADILVYRANMVPVGEDQVSHLELVRELARRFNHLYGRESGFEEKAKAAIKKLGSKRAKRYEQLRAAFQEQGDQAALEAARVHRSDPGTPEKCPVWSLHKIYSDQARQAWVQKGCTTAGIGCLECKQPVIDAIIAEQEPIKERAQKYLDDPSLVRAIVADGCERARKLAEETMRDVREVMGLAY